MSRRVKQEKLILENKNTSYGGSLQTTRKGRAKARPLAVRSSMHLVLRSSKAKGTWSFRQTDNRKKIDKILNRFSAKYGVRLISRANVGNHIHLQIKLSNRHAYKPFIRAITAAIAMAVTGASRWRPLNTLCEGKFWDRRPFTRVVLGFKNFLNLQKYIALNQLEGAGLCREQARYVLAKEWQMQKNSS